MEGQEEPSQGRSGQAKKRQNSRGALLVPPFAYETVEVLISLLQCQGRTRPRGDVRCTSFSIATMEDAQREMYTRQFHTRALRLV